MAHNPVNHPLRPLYRSLGFLASAYLVVFGVVGLIRSSDLDFTGLSDTRIFGQGSSTLWSILAIIIGGIAAIAFALGRNLDVAAGKFLGWATLVFGSYGLATSRTDANFLGFTIITVIITYIVGLVLITSSLYGKVVPGHQVGAPRQVREGRTA
jgi:hypothetical protein